MPNSFTFPASNPHPQSSSSDQQSAGSRRSVYDVEHIDRTGPGRHRGRRTPPLVPTVHSDILGTDMDMQSRKPTEAYGSKCRCSLRALASFSLRGDVKEA